MLQVTFCGAARTVTGSMYFFEYHNPNYPKFNFCVDAGLFQVGQKANLFRINSHLLFDPKKLDALILTHGHLDHCGRIPYLTKMGFGGKIYSTPATKKVAEVVLEDAVKHQAENLKFPDFFFDAEGMSKQDLDFSQNTSFTGLLKNPNFDHRVLKDREKISGLIQKYGQSLTLYSLEEVGQSLNRFETQEYRIPFLINPNLQVEFYDAGHILGSCYLRITELSSGQTIVLSGDLGKPGKPIIKDPEKPEIESKITHIFLETTYGDRVHSKESPQKKLQKILYKTYKQRGKLIIPSFSVERAQEIIYYLIELIADNKVPKMPIYLDSPMASKILDIFLNHPELYDNEMQQKIQQNLNPLTHKNLHILESTRESKSINEKEGPFVIIAGSGMVTGGRILKHLKLNIEDSNNIILFIGFQAHGTLGRRILDGARNIEIEGKALEVQSSLEVISELSGHADKQGLKNWIFDLIKDNKTKNPTAFLVHGEKEEAISMREELEFSFKQIQTGWPHFGQKTTLWKT
jgi:metallo-beta-lactamase family protein